ELRALWRQAPLRRIRRLEAAAGLRRRAVSIVEAACRAVGAHVAAELRIRHARAGVLVRRAQVPGGDQVWAPARARRAQRERAVGCVGVLPDDRLRHDAALGVAPDVGEARLPVAFAEPPPHVVDVAPGVAHRPAYGAIRGGPDGVAEPQGDLDDLIRAG